MNDIAHYDFISNLCLLNVNFIIIFEKLKKNLMLLLTNSNSLTGRNNK